MNKPVNVTLKISVSIEVTESEIQKIVKEVEENYSDETAETIRTISARIAASRKVEGIEGLYDVCVEESYVD